MERQLYHEKAEKRSRLKEWNGRLFTVVFLIMVAIAMLGWLFFLVRISILLIDWFVF